MIIRSTRTLWKETAKILRVLRRFRSVLPGPLKVNGEFADGEFLIPLATTEGTLIASYNRGIKVLNLSAA